LSLLAPQGPVPQGQLAHGFAETWSHLFAPATQCVEGASATNERTGKRGTHPTRYWRGDSASCGDVAVSVGTVWTICLYFSIRSGSVALAGQRVQNIRHWDRLRSSSRCRVGQQAHRLQCGSAESGWPSQSSVAAHGTPKRTKRAGCAPYHTDEGQHFQQCSGRNVKAK